MSEAREMTREELLAVIQKRGDALRAILDLIHECLGSVVPLVPTPTTDPGVDSVVPYGSDSSAVRVGTSPHESFASFTHVTPPTHKKTGLGVESLGSVHSASEGVPQAVEQPESWKCDCTCGLCYCCNIEHRADKHTGPPPYDRPSPDDASREWLRAVRGRLLAARENGWATVRNVVTYEELADLLDLAERAVDSR